MFSGKMEKILLSSPENERKWVYDSLEIASSVLKDVIRSDGSPFMEHVTGVASIIATEVGLLPGAVAAFFLH
jgi:(p)ppGpp synthase/HD superfamily hydrolase